MPLTFEFEDVIARVDDADILAPPWRWNSSTSRALYRATNYLRSRAGLRTDPGIASVEINQDYEIFFCMLSFAFETPALKKLKNLRKRCRKAVCMFTELWTSHADSYRRSIEILNELEFDHVFVHHRSSVDALRNILRCPCSFLPLAADCDRFTPYPVQPARVIDCYSLGRRSEDTHQSLLSIAAEGRFFYLYDTFKTGKIGNWREHRDLIAGNIKRSRYFMAYKPALRTDVVIGKDESLAARYFEGAAAGAVMLGVAPDCADYHENFDWPDATIPLPVPCHDIRPFLEELDARPERLAVARQNNVCQSLRRHDWSYRWASVLESVGLERSAAHHKREHKLRRIASELESSDAFLAFEAASVPGSQITPISNRRSLI
jgi:hypothetical protein